MPISLFTIMIGRPENKTDVLDYVLEDFSRNERNLLNAMRDSLMDTIYQTIAIMGSPQGILIHRSVEQVII